MGTALFVVVVIALVGILCGELAGITRSKPTTVFVVLVAAMFLLSRGG